ncbi:MAG: protein translocase subunit SecD, partial [Planctomycetes bacterium]|nr:protein translocase subunit SecD [Planctomycetota bacterium]
MNKNLIVKLVIILGIIGLCMAEIIPVNEKLKKGIDLAGGTSLIYSIDTTGLTELEKSEIEEQMIRILRNRLDPNNKRNLVWRAHGGGRIEIQMPLPTADTQVKRQEYKDLISLLKGYNLEIIQVRQAMVRQVGVSESQYTENRSRQFDEVADQWLERMDVALKQKSDQEMLDQATQESLTAGRQERRALLEALATAQDAYESDRADQTTALETKMSSQTAISEAGINLTELDNLYGRWRTLNDPNQTEELKFMVGDDQVQQDLIRAYMDVRTEVGFLRGALLDPESGTEMQLSKAWDEVELVNINFDQLDLLLESSDGKETSAIIELKNRHALVSGLFEGLVEAYKDFSEVKGQLDDPEDLKHKLRGSGVLEFRILPSLNEGLLSEGEIETHKERLMTFGPDRPDSKERYVWKKIKDPDDFPTELVFHIAERDGIKYVLASNMPEDNEVMLRQSGGGEWRLKNARPSADSFGLPSVAFSFDQGGTGLFFNMTKDHVDRALCILLDDEAFSAPNISGPIYGGVEITGKFSQQDVQDMVDKLNAGALPARLSDQPESENTIGPTLGASNLNSGLQAGFWGLMAVAAFILVYYMVAGSLADIALFMNLLMIMGVMALSRATFTMPGIAGLILTIGMAVDANVLVFERIREEQQRGSSLRMAIKSGYRRAFRTILGADVTTFITAMFLWVFAS